VRRVSISGPCWCGAAPNLGAARRHRRHPVRVILSGLLRASIEAPTQSDVIGGIVSQVAYEIRIAGKLGPAAQEAFAGLGMDTEPTSTVLSGEMDQAALHGLLDRVRALGLELVDIRRVRRL
jgi:hypothetical protein